MGAGSYLSEIKMLLSCLISFLMYTNVLGRIMLGGVQFKDRLKSY